MFGIQTPTEEKPRIFASEDSLGEWLQTLSPLELGAVYSLIYLRGVRYDSRLLEQWRKSLK